MYKFRLKWSYAKNEMCQNSSAEIMYKSFTPMNFSLMS